MNYELTNNDDTIVALCTPRATAALATLRVSGQQALAIVARRWKGAPLEAMASHTAHLGNLLDSDGNLLDEVVLTVFRGPHSFTGEDVVELSCHGSTWIQQQAVLTLIDAGARQALPGEFTRRAFTNRRLDLSQAEAVADVIASRSRASHRVAMNQMRGAFARRLATLRARLLEFVSLLELELDFSEEDVTFADRAKLLELAREIHSEVLTLARSYHNGNAIKNGVPVAIVGHTNAGKSTLLNALVGDDRAIVSDVHGTTRDVIEDTVELGGTLFRFCDTAGLRDTTDTVERLGIERTLRMLDEARIIIWMIDATAPRTDIDSQAALLTGHVEGKKLIAVINKNDVAGHHDIEAAKQAVTAIVTPHALIETAVATPGGADPVATAIAQAADWAGVDDEALVVTNARHYEALTAAGQALERVITGLEQGLSGDLVGQDLREAMHHLGTITGQITTHELLGSIFSRFCVGK